jgi:hypothetical protein
MLILIKKENGVDDGTKMKPREMGTPKSPTSILLMT